MSNGVYVNCGSYRPAWLRANQDRVMVQFGFSLEVPAGIDTTVLSEELTESVCELLSRWSRRSFAKYKKFKRGGKT